MLVSSFSATAIDFHRNIRRCIPEDRTFNGSIFRTSLAYYFRNVRFLCIKNKQRISFRFFVRSLDKGYKIEVRSKIVFLFVGASMLWISEIMKHNFIKIHVVWSAPKDVRGINFGTIWKCKPLILHEAEINSIFSYKKWLTVQIIFWNKQRKTML
jgi:hypothetical protein